VGGVLAPFEMTLAGELDAQAMARAAVVGWPAGQVDDATLADAQLLVGELAVRELWRGLAVLRSLCGGGRVVGLRRRANPPGSRAPVAR
jgi:hypothetical protein